MKQNNNRSLIFLMIFAVLTVVLFNMPFGRYVLYPFIILGTWFHEMSHGLMAIAMGGSFHKLELFADGSGLAYHSGGLFLGPIGNAMVAAGGPLGPTTAGSLLLLASKNQKVSRISLYILGFFQVISSLRKLRQPPRSLICHCAAVSRLREIHLFVTNFVSIKLLVPLTIFQKACAALNIK